MTFPVNFSWTEGGFSEVSGLLRLDSQALSVLLEQCISVFSLLTSLFILPSFIVECVFVDEIY